MDKASIIPVSVVIPVYNAEKTLNLCLDAVLNQDYPSFEVIVVDDCSTDSSPSIYSLYGVRIIRLDENRGPAYARQEGVKIARGEAIAFTDSDCVPPINWLSILMSRLTRDLGGVSGNYTPYYPDNWVNRFAIGDQFYLWFQNQLKETTVLNTGNCIYWRDILLNRQAPEITIMKGIPSGDDTIMALEISKKHRLRLFSDIPMPHIDRTDIWGLLKQKATRGKSRAIISILFPMDKVLNTKDINMLEVAFNLAYTALLIPLTIVLLVFHPVYSLIPLALYPILNIKYLMYWLKREKGMVFPLYAMLLHLLRNLAFFYGGIRGVVYAFKERVRLRKGYESMRDAE